MESCCYESTDCYKVRAAAHRKMSRPDTMPLMTNPLLVLTLRTYLFVLERRTDCCCAAATEIYDVVLVVVVVRLVVS